MKNKIGKKLPSLFPKRNICFGFLFLMITSIPSCDLFSGANQELEMTLEVLKRQQTAVALTPNALTPNVLTQSVPPSSETPVSQIKNIESTEPATLVTNSVNTIQAGDDLTHQKYLDGKIKSSQILLFEDMSGSGEIRYVKEALDHAGYFYLDVGSAKGWFKNQLISTQDWDLIIAAAEARRDFGGEYFELMHENVKRGSAAIIEFWNIDEAPIGKIKPLFEDCGIEFQSDWYDPDLRSIFWLENENVLLHEPNEIGPKLREATSMWFGDVGDLVKLTSQTNNLSGETKLIAGTNPSWKNDHATLISCLNGRVIIQTFSSHDFSREDMIALWKNYVYNALKAHHELKLASESILSISGILPAPGMDSTENAQTNQAEEAGLGSIANCNGYLEVRVPAYPTFQKDMFEHHANGLFLLLDLEIENKSSKPIQIWDGDYSIYGMIGDETVEIPVHNAATGYLYLENPINLSQDVIEPGGVWRTKLAFDIDPHLSNKYLIIKPGSEANAQLCEVKIQLD